ncbi:MAG: (R)-mandelonitrile lyase [Candidatus Sericytochromatia bacterium]
MRSHLKFTLPIVIALAISSVSSAKEAIQEKSAATSADDISQFAPEFHRLTAELINGDLWKRTDLSPRDRSLVTVTILATLNKTEQIDFHLNKALDNDLKQEDIVAAMTHTAFYAGWPSGYTGITHLKTVLEKRKPSSSESLSMKVFAPATMPTVAGSSAYFTGSVKITPLVKGEEPSNLESASVIFQPSARTAWHSHPRGQLLVVTEGAGLIQEYGKPIRNIKPGDVIWTPPGVQHWHGAKPDSAMTHIASHESLNGTPVKWMDKVSDQEYSAAAK